MTRARLLLVDDELSLLRLLERYLSRLGFEVVACSRAEDALSRFEAAPQAFSLVMLDLNLPGMSGEELLHKLLRASETIRAIVCSGDVISLARFPEACRWRVSFLQKPFVPRMLSETIEDTLGRRPDATQNPLQPKAD